MVEFAHEAGKRLDALEGNYEMSNEEYDFRKKLLTQIFRLEHDLETTHFPKRLSSEMKRKLKASKNLRREINCGEVMQPHPGVS